MATRKLNIDLTKPISVESQMALVVFARQHRAEMLKGIGEWLDEKRPLCNGDPDKEWWYEDDAHTMRGIVYSATNDIAWWNYSELDTLVRDWFIDIASGVYAEEQEAAEPVLKTYRIYYTLHGAVDIEAESEDIARELFYDQEMEQMVWEDVLTNELEIMDSEEVTV